MDVLDRLKGALFGIHLADAMCTEKSSYIEGSEPSSSLRMAESLAKILTDVYQTNSALDSYKSIYERYSGPPGIATVSGNFEKNFKEKFDLDFDQVFEDHPKNKITERTGIYHRTAILTNSKTLDDFITEVWMFDPYIETFEEVYFFFVTLRLLIKFGRDSLLETLKIDVTNRIRQIVNETLTNDLDLRFIEDLDREEFCVFGATLGAVKGYSAMMSDPVLRFGSRNLDLCLLDEEIISSLS